MEVRDALWAVAGKLESLTDSAAAPESRLNDLTALEHQIYRNHPYRPDECGECGLSRQIADQIRTELDLSAASPAAQQEVNCSNERCMDGWVDQAGSSPDGTEYWVDQVPCLVCGIHVDPDDTRAVAEEEKEK